MDLQQCLGNAFLSGKEVPVSYPRIKFITAMIESTCAESPSTRQSAGLVQTSSPRYCYFARHAVTLLADGRITCGLDDMWGAQTYGDTGAGTVQAAWDGPVLALRRRALDAGTPCAGCHLSHPLDQQAGARVGEHAAAPDHLIVETSFACNIRCNGVPCGGACKDPAERAKIRTRDRLDPVVFRRVVDELAPHLKLVYFFHYGETFLHAAASEMIGYLRGVNPQVRIEASTNVLPFGNHALAERVAAAGLDKITCTLPGVTEKAYLRYHRDGDFKRAMQGLENLCRASRAVDGRLHVLWRYLVFHWNDSDAEIDEARRLARELGVSQLAFHLTHVPAGAISHRRMPGAPGHARVSDSWDHASGYLTHVTAITTSPDGFFARELHPGHGPFRWSGPRFRVTVPPMEEWCVLRLMSPAWVPATRVEALSGAMAFAVVAHPNRWTELQVRSSDGAPLQIEAEVKTTTVPSRNGRSIDDRELGVMVSLLTEDGRELLAV